MKTQAAQAAALFRAEIKKAYPGLKFKCTSKNYAGGSSIRVEYEDQPKEVHEAIKAMSHKYQYGHFDGMQDLYEYDNVKDHAQAKHVFVSNVMSDAKREEIYQRVRKEWHGGDQLPERYEDARNIHFQGDYVSQFVWRQFHQGAV